MPKRGSNTLGIAKQVMTDMADGKKDSRKKSTGDM